MIEWKPIPGYEGHYSVSDTGLVRNDRFGKMRRLDRTPKGYIQIVLYKGGVRTMHYVHRLVMLAFEGPSDLQVNHKDTDRTNNNLSNLEYITPQGNQQHAAITNGRGSSKYLGVCWAKSKNRWQAQSNGKHIGYFEDEVEAAKAYNRVNAGSKYLNDV